MRIVVDAMGGDFAPRAVVDGALAAAARFGWSISLVGHEEQIRAEMRRLNGVTADIHVVHAADAIGMDELAPAAAIRRSPDSSIARGMKLVRDGDADAFVTVGHTGAALAGAMFRLGRLRSVRRPALATPFPTLQGPCVLLDIGANTEVRPTDLLQFAIMGASYAQAVLGIERPRVGLLSNGEERGKGTDDVKNAIPLLERSGLNFVGNLEGRDIALGNADVAVTDGFTGNILIKFAEGIGAVVGQMLREAIGRDPIAAIGGLAMSRSFSRLRQRMDYRAYGGAILLGVRGVVIVGHGRSDADGVAAAIKAAGRGVEHDLVPTIQQAIARSLPEMPEAST